MKNLAWYLFIIIIVSACSSTKQTARIILLPDTQTYTSAYPSILQSQADWIRKEAGNIDFVLQQGDLTDHNNDVQWQIVKEAFTKIDHLVPYSLAVGNHDMGSAPKIFADNRNTDLFNQYFPQSHMSALPGFGGTYEEGKMENAYYFLETGKQKWLILTLEFGPRNKIIDWANKLVAMHPEQTVILNTHAYMYSDSTRQGPGDSWRAKGYGVGKDEGEEAVNDGEEIWNKLVKLHPNIRFVFSGHVLNSGVGTLVSINDAGLPVYQMLANYQGGVINSENGGNGNLRILDFDFKKKTIDVKTFSPHTNKVHTVPGHNFTIKHVLFGAGLK